MTTIAIPSSNGQLDPHFGHCAQFTLFDVQDDGRITGEARILDAPPHQPGLLPGWLAEQGAHLVLAGGMGQRAIQLFNEHNIEVIIGIQPAPVDQIVQGYLAGGLKSGGNLCDH